MRFFKKLLPLLGCLKVGFAAIEDYPQCSVFEIKTDSPYEMNGMPLGDINRDGFDDTGFVDVAARTAYIIFGSSSVNNINLKGLSSPKGFKITGLDIEMYSGDMMMPAGDVNGDGYADFMILNEKQIYVILGGSSLSDFKISHMTGSQGFIITAIPPSSNVFDHQIMGNPVAIGDVNKDGYADIAIATMSRNKNQKRGYIVYGSANPTNVDAKYMTSKQGFQITSTKYQYNSLDFKITPAGDINNDGYADILVGKAIKTDMIHVVFGGSTNSDVDLDNFDSSRGFKITSKDFYLVEMGVVGDMNGDKISDIYIKGEPKGYTSFKAFVLLGRANGQFNDIDLDKMTESQGISIVERELTGIARAGDVNGDGYDDLVIGNMGAGSGWQPSKVIIIYGHARLFDIDADNLTPTEGMTVFSKKGKLGKWVYAAGDVNHDGYADVILGSIFEAQSHILLGGKNPTRCLVAYK